MVSRAGEYRTIEIRLRRDLPTQSDAFPDLVSEPREALRPRSSTRRCGDEEVHLARNVLSELGISLEAIRARGLIRYEEAKSLEIVEIGDDGEAHRLVPVAGHAWRRLKSAAEIDGQSLFIESAFRSVSGQVEIIRERLFEGQTIEQILTACAPPGFSEHHTGRAVDVNTVGVLDPTRDFEGTPAFRWMRENAGRFGFRLSYPRDNAFGYVYEPWHWCFAAPE